MRVLVATGRTQGHRANDYDWCVEGELVRVGEVCAADRSDPDGGCGCGRGFAGLDSHRATTTARVADLGLTRTDYAGAIRSGLAAQGWPLSWFSPEQEADDLAAAVAGWPPGTVVERRLDELRVRELPEP